MRNLPTTWDWRRPWGFGIAVVIWATASSWGCADSGRAELGTGTVGVSSTAELNDNASLKPTCEPNLGDRADSDANIVLGTVYQDIRGFGGISVPGWIDDLTPSQTDTAFGSGAGQIGLSILRVRVPYNAADFSREVATAQRAASLGATVFATPWTPPPALKTNNNIVGGELRPDAYGAYADHLLSFRDYMKSKNVPLYAISVQNEPDIKVQYESCDWTASQFIKWLSEQGPRFERTKLIAAESFNFNHQLTDPILNDARAQAAVDIIGGHLYGNGLRDYPLARSKGKEVWMTEHYTDSKHSANEWPLALDVAKEIHQSMLANFNAYVWWYIRRSYGLLTEDGKVSKRGYLMAQYARFVRPGFQRVAVSSTGTDVQLTAYKNGAGQVVVVALNTTASPKAITLDLHDGCATSWSRFTTSATKDLSDDGSLPIIDHRAKVTLDAESVSSFVSR